MGDISVIGSNYADINNDAKGYGGGIIGVNPVAAMAKNSLTTNTDVALSGTWDGIGSMTAVANNGDELKLTADSATAAVVGASGTEITNQVGHTANVRATGNITSNGKQSYTANNNVNHDVKLKGSGYGGASVNANVMDNKLNYTAGIDISDAVLTGTGSAGSIEALAYTSGKMDYNNILKSAGVVPVTVAVSNNAITYDNSVKVKKSTLKTSKLDQDITLAATDETEGTFETTADTQGGAVGAASAKTDNNLTRNNKIAVDGGKLFSTNDVNIYAGANTEGISSSLDYNVTADAYNKTAIPLCNAPKVSNVMKQNNQVSINGDIDSVRHVNFKAGKGLTTVVTSAREYNIYTGESGKGSVASTALGDDNDVKDEVRNNFVNIASGKTVRAGVHNNLTLDISGETTFTDPQFNADGSVKEEGKINYNINKNATVGGDWFDVNSNIKVTEIEIANGLYSRLLEIDKVIGDYSKDSAEYTKLLSERTRIVTQMEENGFIKTSTEGGKTYKEIFSEITLPAVEVNDIIISGGNINIDADKVTGSGTLSAQGAGDLTINNSSDLYLKINDLVIKDKGGEIHYNDKSVSNIAGFNGTLNKGTTSTTGTEPTITVSSTGTSTNNITKADIGVFGTVQNSTGDVLIKNSNYNINVDGDANISARNITLQADKGSVTQNSKGLLLIGGDPVTKYQFNDAISKLIQSYLSKKAMNNESVDWLNNIMTWEDYRKAISDHATDLGLTSEQKKIVDSYTIDKSSGIVAGNNIYISGLNVNIDGLVQSGFKDYNVKLDAAANSKIAKLDNAYKLNRKALSDQEVMSNEKYCISTNAGAHYKDGAYEYIVKVYYNPSTGELLTESIEPNGGKIYITGAVSSTGNGKIRAMDGTPNIDIDTSAVSKNLRVNKIANKDITGLISIKDTQKNTLTEYTTDGNNITKTETTLTNKGNVSNATKTNTVSGSSTTYDPAKDMSISWTGGTSGDKKVIEWQYKKDFIAWGLIKYGTTEDFIKDSEVAQGKTETASSSITGEDPLGQGTFIGINSTSKGYSVSTKDYQDKDQTKYSSVSTNKKYDGTWGKIFGYGECTYTWTETQSHSTSSTYTIKADKGIDVGFMTGGNGNINITSQKDMLLNGNISNATKSDGSAIGNINLVSNAGSISSLGNARVNADNLTVSAATGVDINHGALGSGASIDVKSTNGNVTINSDKGNLTFTGGTDAGAQAGNLDITAAGNLATADGTTLNGTRIDFTSGGTINANIHGGQAPTSSDTMSASVNAKAQGNITLTQNNEDMRLGIIDSQAGDVVLNVENGSFVDAYNDADTGYSDTASKIQNWIDNGLISSADGDDSNTNAAQEAYEERINGLNNRANSLAQTSEAKNTAQNYKDEAANMAKDGTLLQAKETYIKAVREADGDQTKIDSAYATYKAAQKAYFEQRATQGSSYSAEERDLIIGFAEVGTDSSKYGWSKNQLLYAIQDTILNSEPGQKVDPTTQANVIGNNITLNAKNGGIGIDAAPETISYDNLTTIDNMKKLAASKAGDLTWDDEKVTIRHQQPINLELRNKETGVVTVNGRYNVYIAAIKDSTLNFNKVETTGDIKLMADNGINMIGTDGIISGKNLIIGAGKGSIGSQGKHIVTKVTGTVDANAGEYIYLEQKDGVLNLLTVAAGRDINIIADAGMKMSGEYSDQAGYINSTGGVINLTSSNGSIGTATENEYIRINNNGAVVNANAKNGVYIKGKKNGTMVLGEVDSEGTVQIISEGGVALGRAASETQTAVTGVINAVGNGNINARGDIDLTNGSVNITGDNNQFTMQAVGEVRQNENSGGIVTNTLNVHADKSHLLLSKQNNVRNLNASYYENEQKLIDGVLRFNGINEELNVSLVNPTEAVKGDVEITNLHANGNVNIKTSIKAAGDGSEDHKGSINVVANNNIVTDSGTALEANNDIIMSAQNGSITTNGTLNAKNNVKLTSNNSQISTVGSVTATNGNVEFTAKEGIKTTGDITSTNADVILANTNNAIEISKLTGKNVSVTNGNGNISANADITATGGDITLKTTTSGDIITAENAKLEASADGENGGNIIIEAAGSIHTKGIIKANRQVKANATKGFEATKSIEAGEDITIINKVENGIRTADLTAKNITVTNDNGLINIGGAAKASDGDVTLTAKDGSITTSDTVHASNDVTAKATTNITTEKVVSAGNNVGLTAGTNIETKADVTANKGSVIYDAKTGITANGNVTAGGNVGMTNQNNNITTGANAAVKAGNDVTMKNNNGNIETGSTVTAENGNASFTVDQNGNVTTNGDVKANKDITYDAKGSITTGGSINSTEGNIKLTTNDKADLSTTETAGSINFNGNVSAANGNIEIIVEGNGNVNDNDKLFKATGTKDDANSGNIMLQVKGTGDVDLKEIYATNDAKVDVANGNLTLAKIDGNLVAIQLRTEGKKMDVKEIIAGTKIIAKGSNMDLDKIKQRTDADGMLSIVPDGARDDAPIDNLRIGEISTNTGVRFEHLWLNNGSIHVSDGKFHIDKLVVNDNAHFSNKHMTTAVWGNPPQRDHSDSVFWNNTALNNPAQNLAEWQKEDGVNADKWMFLHFTEIPNIQRSNGVLLDLTNYDYVYNQRFTAVDHLLKLLTENKADAYDINYNPEVVHYFRYDLYDLDEVEQQIEQNADPAKIAIEA